MKKKRISLYDAINCIRPFVHKELFSKAYIEYGDISVIASTLLGNYKNVELTLKYKDNKFILEMIVKGLLGGPKEYEVRNVPKEIQQKALDQERQREWNEGLFHYWMNRG